jgi:hypothetical protein
MDILLVVVSSTYDFLYGWSEEDGMFELGGVRALDIAERRIILYDTRRNKVI